MNPEEIVLDQKALEAISEKVVAGLTPVVEEKVKSAVSAKEEEMKQAAVEAAEKTIKKNVDAPQGVENPIAKEAKEIRFVKSAIALLRGDRRTVKAYNKYVAEKAGYANSDISADGGYILADPEFEAEIEKLAAVYGISFAEATVVPTMRDTIKTNKRGSNVTMYETGEGVAKTGTKLTISQVTVTLRKFAAIAIATDELVEDAAIDFWSEVTQGFAEERARIADELVFTDDDATYPGILHTDGVAVESCGASINDLTWDDLLNAEVDVPTRAMQNGKFYMHRTVWNIVRKSKDDNNRYQLMPSAGLQTPWGTPVVLVDVLPNASVVGDSNEGYIVFGDLKRVKLYVKKGLVLTPSRDATVADANGSDVNLYEQDMSALRAVSRMVALVKFPEAFCVIGTGTVS